MVSGVEDGVGVGEVSGGPESAFRKRIVFLFGFKASIAANHDMSRKEMRDLRKIHNIHKNNMNNSYQELVILHKIEYNNMIFLVKGGKKLCISKINKTC